MPEPTRWSKPKVGGDDLPAPVASSTVVEPRCHVCTSKYRKAIDRMIAIGTPHSEISRLLNGEIERRSISNHAKQHLNYEEAAIARIIEKQMEDAGEDIEAGVSGAVKRRVYAEALLQRGLENLIEGDAMVEPKDVLKVIELLNKLDGDSQGASAAQVEMQFHAFVTAIREICGPEVYHRILDRTREIVGNSTDAGRQIEDGD